MYTLFLALSLGLTHDEEAARAAVAVELARLSPKKAESDPFTQKPVVKQSLTTQKEASRKAVPFARRPAGSSATTADIFAPAVRPTSRPSPAAAREVSIPIGAIGVAQVGRTAPVICST